MARPKKIVDATIETNVEEVTTTSAPVVDEKAAILAWLRSGQLNMFERNTRWLAHRIEDGDHLK